jgi:hypothetical protein
MKNSTILWLAAGAALATAVACGGGTTSNNGNDAGSGSGSGTASGSGSGSGSVSEAGTCVSKSDCPSGELCCGTSILPPASGCVTTCPSLTGVGAVQLCATSDECATSGYVCQMFGAMFSVCAPLFDGGFVFDGGRRPDASDEVDGGPDAASEVDSGAQVDAAPDAAPVDAAGGG